MSNRPNRKTSASTRVAEARQGSGSRTIWIIVAVVVVVVFAGVIAVAVSGSGGSAEGGVASPSGGTVVPSGDLSYGPVEVQGSALPEYDRRAATDPADGATVPTVTGVGFDDSPVDIAPAGKAMIVMLLSHSCPHCQAEVPRIQQWLDDNGMPSDVALYSIVTGTSPSKANYPPGDWLREEGWSVPTLVDDEQNSAAMAYGLTAYPFFVVTDSSGQVVYRTTGELSDAQWAALVDAARNGTAPSGGGGASSSAG